MKLKSRSRAIAGRAAMIGIAAITAIGFVIGAAELAYPHPATNVAGFPLGWDYEPGCCKAAATSPTGDCAPIDAKYVKEKPDGYHVDLPVGAHPKLVTKGYSSVIPYEVARNSPEGNYHICLSTDGAHRFCFYAGARGF